MEPYISDVRLICYPSHVALNNLIICSNIIFMVTKDTVFDIRFKGLKGIFKKVKC